MERERSSTQRLLHHTPLFPHWNRNECRNTGWQPRQSPYSTHTPLRERLEHTGGDSTIETQSLTSFPKKNPLWNTSTVRNQFRRPSTHDSRPQSPVSRRHRVVSTRRTVSAPSLRMPVLHLHPSPYDSCSYVHTWCHMSSVICAVIK